LSPTVCRLDRGDDADEDVRRRDCRAAPAVVQIICQFASLAQPSSTFSFSGMTGMEMSNFAQGLNNYSIGTIAITVLNTNSVPLSGHGTAT
jgi:hypothetical protein